MESSRAAKSISAPTTSQSHRDFIESGGLAVESKRIPRAIVMSKLVLRSGPSMTSQRLRDITAGTSLIVIDTIDSPSQRTVRAKVALESSPRGGCVLPLGWVTAHKEGDQKLEVVVEGPCDLPPRLAITEPGDTIDDASLAKRIAERRLAKAERRKESRLEAEAAAPATDAQPHRPRGQASPGTSLSPLAKLRAGIQSVVSEGEPAKKKEKVYPWLNAASLRQQTDHLEARAVRAESGQAEDSADGSAGGGGVMEGSNATLLKVGHYLQEKRTKADDIVGEWDGAGKGVLHKSVFKSCIKNLNLPNVSQADMDGLYAQLLGEEKALSTETVKAVLRDAKRDAASLGERMKIGRARAKRLREVKQLYAAALTATEVSEENERALEAMRQSPPVGVRFGRHLAKMSLLAPRDVMKRWDDDGSGGVDFDELSNALGSIQFKFEPPDVPVLFELLDQNGDGDIDLEDLKSAIKVMTHPQSGMTAQHVAAERMQARVCAEKRGDAKAAQQVCQRAFATMDAPA